MNKDVGAASTFCVQCALVTEAIIYSPAKARSGESGSPGDWEVEPQLPIVGRYTTSPPLRTFVQEMNS